MAAYSPEFGKSLSTGISALVKGKEKYYILEHLVGSHYHQAGEKQEVLLDEIILGRDADCHVRFDENFNTVSRHHASIVRDGDNWRLIQLSQTNTTFLNGKAIQDSWYLQSGDEIQLAVNGPKLIFRIPTETAEFKFTQRLGSFKEQVIRPYQTAFIIVCCVIVLLIAGCVTAVVMIKHDRETIEIMQDKNNKLLEQVDLLSTDLMKTNVKLDEAAEAADDAQKELIRQRNAFYQSEARRIKEQKNLQEVTRQLQQLQEEMETYLNGITNGENQ